MKPNVPSGKGVSVWSSTVPRVDNASTVEPESLPSPVVAAVGPGLIGFSPSLSSSVSSNH